MAAQPDIQKADVMTDNLQPIPPGVIEEAVMRALEEDGAFHDVTTAALIGSGDWGRGVLVAKEEGIIAGLAVAATVMTLADDSISFDELVADGASVRAGDQLAEVEGRMAALLASERVALNFLQRLSGVATLTRAFVDAVDGTRASILDTRKTTPGLRLFERYAVRAGGGRNHRFNLSDGILIKDNHLAALRERGTMAIGEVVRRARAGAPHTLRIEIEVTTAEEAGEAADAGADIILLDNMQPSGVAAAVRAIAGRALIEASGGVTLDNVRAIAEAGVDFISVGGLTHSAPALDISLEIQGV